MLASLAAAFVLQTPPAKIAEDSKVTDLKDGYIRVETPSYIIEVPKGWNVSEETPWGARKAYPAKGGELGVMTAPPGRQSWDRLYQTSLFFIMREDSGTPTPYRIEKTKSGLEAMVFAVKNKEGFEDRRYFMIKHEEKGLLALSVRIPSRDAEKQWAAHFRRMIDTAQFK